MKRISRIFLMILVASLLCACSKGTNDSAQSKIEDIEKEAPENWVTSILVSINPQVRLYLDENDAVIKAVALNDDGEKILTEIKIEGQSFQDAATSICEQATVQGYVKDDTKISFVEEQTAISDKTSLKDTIKETMTHVYKHLSDTMNVKPMVVLEMHEKDEQGDDSVVEEILEICGTCNGEKRIVCATCNGTHSVVCGVCQGTKEKSCHECQGAGTVTCRGCEGGGKTIFQNPDCSHCHGSRVCKNCDGVGETYAYGGAGTEHENVIVGSEICFACNGSGACNNCLLGDECPDCSTRNIDGVEVDNPYGPGIVACESCNASGKEECQDCSPEGTVACGSCEDGYVDCPDCE